MSADLKGLLQSTKTNPKVGDYDEAKAKAGIILPTLHFLGWNTFNVEEVAPEFTVGTRSVDYALRIEGNNRVFIEAKKAASELDDHQKQILDYSFEAGVELAVLTNGLLWWFYLPLTQGDWRNRKFYAIDIRQQELDEVAERFQGLLSKENVRSGKAREYAEQLKVTEVKKREIEKAFPDAWDKIISEFHPALLSLVSETTETMCGHRPSEDETRNLLERYKAKLLLSEQSATPVISGKPMRPIKPEAPSKPTKLLLLFTSPTPHEESLIIGNILDRKELWVKFIQKRVLTTNEFKGLSHFKPIAVGAFTRFLTEHNLAKRTYGNTFTIQEDVIPAIATLLDKGLEKPSIPPPDFETIPRAQIQRHILDRVKLWGAFIERRKMTDREFKKYSTFKPRSIGAFFHFLTANGIAVRRGATFELVPDVAPSIERLIRTIQ